QYRGVELLHDRIAVREECRREIQRKRGVGVEIVPLDQIADRADEDRLEPPLHVLDVEMIVGGLDGGIGHDGPPGERGATPFSWVSAPRITASNASEPRRFPARDRRTPNEDACSVYFGPRGSIGVVPRTPRISSSTL